MTVWPWQDLVVAVVAAILGWLSGWWKPPPGTMRRP